MGKIIRIAAILLFTPLISNGKAPFDVEDTLRTYSSNYFSLIGTTGLYNRVRTSHDTNNFLSNRNMLSGEFGIGYFHRSSKLNLHTALNFGIVPQNITYSLKVPASSGFYQPDNPDLILGDKFTNYIPANLYFSPSLLISKEFQLATNLSFEVGLGGRLYFFASNRTDINYGTGIYVDSLNTNLLPLFSAYLGDTAQTDLNWATTSQLGINFISKNCKHFSVHLQFIYSPQKRLKGYYFFQNLGYSYSGNLEQGINYLAVKFTYHWKM